MMFRDRKKSGSLSELPGVNSTGKLLFGSALCLRCLEGTNPHDWYDLKILKILWIMIWNIWNFQILDDWMVTSIKLTVFVAGYLRKETRSFTSDNDWSQWSFLNWLNKELPLIKQPNRKEGKLDDKLKVYWMINPYHPCMVYLPTIR